MCGKWILLSLGAMDFSLRAPRKEKDPFPRCIQGKGSFNKVARSFDALRYFFRKGVRRSIGTGKIVVEFFSVATSVKV